MVFNSLQAAKILSQKGIFASVWDMHTLKPIDEVAVRKAADKNKLIVTVEEHNVIGGLSSAVSEYLSSYKGNSSQLSIGIEDFFPKPGDYSFMLKQCGLTRANCSEYYIFIKIIKNIWRILICLILINQN